MVLRLTPTIRAVSAMLEPSANWRSISDCLGVRQYGLGVGSNGAGTSRVGSVASRAGLTLTGTGAGSVGATITAVAGSDMVGVSFGEHVYGIRSHLSTLNCGK